MNTQANTSGDSQRAVYARSRALMQYTNNIYWFVFCLLDDMAYSETEMKKKIRIQLTQCIHTQNRHITTVQRRHKSIKLYFGVAIYNALHSLFILLPITIIHWNIHSHLPELCVCRLLPFDHIHSRIYFLFNSFSLGHKFLDNAAVIFAPTSHRSVMVFTIAKANTNYNFPQFFVWVMLFFLLCTNSHCSIFFCFGAKLHAVVSMFGVCVDVAW